MTRTEILRLAAGLVWVLAVAMAATERRILRRLRNASAPDNAMPLAQGSPLVRFRLARLLRGGAVVATNAGRFYLDSEGLARYRERRRRRVLIVLAAVLPLTGAVWWFSRDR